MSSVEDIYERLAFGFESGGDEPLRSVADLRFEHQAATGQVELATSGDWRVAAINKVSWFDSGCLRR